MAKTQQHSTSAHRVPEPVSVHVPVLLDQVVHWLDPKPGMVLVDGTLGGGGHARAWPTPWDAMDL